MSKEKYTIDFTKVNYYLEMHGVIWHALEFPDYYGCNWDAFWDSLRFDSPVDYIKIIGEHTMPDDLKRHLNIMHELLQDCKNERASYGHVFDFEFVD